MSLYSSILRKTALPLLLSREAQGSSLAHFDFFMKSQFWNRQQLLDFQWVALKKLLAESYQHTVFYKNIMDERGLTPDSFKSFEDLQLLPKLTREMTYDNHEQFLSTKYARDSLQQFASGGTTGKRVTLFRDQESFNIKYGLAWRHETWMGRFPCDKMALIWPATMDIDEHVPLRSRIKNRYLHRLVCYDAGGLDKKTLEFINKDLHDFKPDYFKVFPSALFGYTQFCLDNNLVQPKLKGIISTGEPLYENQKQLFEKTYNAPLFDMYGSREVGNTACECDAHHGMHIAEETSLVEFVNNENNSVEFGTEGEMLITDLTNFAFPLIRYAINDYGIPLKDHCSCGRGLQLMDKAMGRLMDNIKRPDGSQILGHVLAISLTLEGPPIGQMQIIQRSINDIKILLTDNPIPNDETLDYIKYKINQLVGSHVQLTIDIVKEIPKEKSGKVRFVKSEI